MKRLSTVLILLGLTGCVYPSRLNAIQACKDWAAETAQSDGVSRWCEDDFEDNQILGRRGGADANGFYVPGSPCKYFRY